MTGAVPALPRVRAYGATATLVDVASARDAASVARWLRRRLTALDVVPAARSVLVDGVAPAAVAEALRGWSPTGEEPTGPLVELEVTYDGADLAFAATRWGVDAGEVGALLAAVDFEVAFCGFAPGFAYLTGLPRALWLPRLDAPRPRVEPGSVAIAGEWCGVYPSASPGGWRVLGHTVAALWDVAREEPALLAPGTRVRMVPGSAR